MTAEWNAARCNNDPPIAVKAGTRMSFRAPNGAGQVLCCDAERARGVGFVYGLVHAGEPRTIHTNMSNRMPAAVENSNVHRASLPGRLIFRGTNYPSCFV
jgi:hypothetical protein